MARTIRQHGGRRSKRPMARAPCPAARPADGWPHNSDAFAGKHCLPTRRHPCKFCNF